MESQAAVVTILSTADFDNPIWTNKQHLAAGLARSHKVVYINSLGLRKPRFNRTDVLRIIRRLFAKRSSQNLAKRTSSAEDTVTVFSPRIIPFHSIALVRLINKHLLRRFIANHLPPHERNILWTFSPITYGIESMFDVYLYHSVDLLHTFAHTPSTEILAAERMLAPRATAVIASSFGVKEHIRRHTGVEALLWENVADTALYSANLQRDAKPRIFFSGNLTPTKIDFDLFFDLAESGIPLAIAGPIAIDGTTPDAQVERLLSYENVEYLGVLAPDALAVEVGNSRVGIVPYLVNEHTAGIFPMKVYEYLAAGLSVICTPLASLRGRTFPEGISVVPRAKFVGEVLSTVISYTPEGSVGRSERAIPYSWSNRISAASSLIEDISSRKREEETGGPD